MEGVGREFGGGASDHVSRSAVEVCGFLTGVALSIFEYLSQFVVFFLRVLQIFNKREISGL